MGKWLKVLVLAAMVLSMSAMGITPAHADAKTAINGTLTTTIEFDEENVQGAKEWIDETLALAKKDLETEMEKAKGKEKQRLKKALKKLDKMSADKWFEERTDGSAKLQIPLTDLQIEIGGRKATTRHNGKFTIPQVPLGEQKLRISKDGKTVREMDVVVKRGHPRMDIDLQIYDQEFQSNIDRMHQAMHSGKGDVHTQEITTYPKLEKGTAVGTGAGKMHILSDEEKNVVSCNKASSHESPEGKKPFDPNAEEEWTSDTGRFPANGSDCSRSIALGMLYNMNSWLFNRYRMSEYCVIESINHVMTEEKDKSYAAYCNWEKKADGRWNCSWFNGVGHTEELHTH